MPSAVTHTTRVERLRLLIGLGTIVLGVALLATVPELRHCVSLVAHGQFTELRAYIQSLGAGGLALLVGLMLVHSIVFFPSEIITATCGYVYGFVPGLVLAVAGWYASALISYALGATVGRPVLRRLLGQRFQRFETAIEGGGAALLVSARLIPIMPFAVVGYAAGATRVPLWRFSWTTVVGYLPITTAVAYLGARAQTLSTSDPLVWVSVGVLVSIVVAERYYHRRSARRGPDDCL